MVFFPFDLFWVMFNSVWWIGHIMHIIVNKYELILVSSIQTVLYFYLCTIQGFFCMKLLTGMRNKIFCERTPVYLTRWDNIKNFEKFIWENLKILTSYKPNPSEL